MFHFSDGTYSFDKKQKFVDDISSKLSLNGPSDRQNGVPSSDYEKLRRRIYTNTDELWNYLRSEVSKVQKKANINAPELVKPLDDLLSLASEHKKSLLNDISQMKMSDGYEHWRYKEAKDLSDLVQRRLTYLQNPEDCSTAKKLVCRLNKGCGYGCQLHHVVYCFIMAYATERTLIIKSKGWRYHKGGWEEVFQPVSDSCLDSNGASHASWVGFSIEQI